MSQAKEEMMQKQSIQEYDYPDRWQDLAKLSNSNRNGDIS